VQSQEVRFTLYNETNGLHRSAINDIGRDSSGYFWLATEKGLVRFDGRNFIDVAPDMPHFRYAEIVKLKFAGNSL
jgi:ligand-binding sensor domain-containing protein